MVGHNVSEVGSLIRKEAVAIPASSRGTGSVTRDTNHETCDPDLALPCWRVSFSPSLHYSQILRIKSPAGKRTGSSITNQILSAVLSSVKRSWNSALGTGTCGCISLTVFVLDISLSARSVPALSVLKNTHSQLWLPFLARLYRRVLRSIWVHISSSAASQRLEVL